jgi:hypothetical protein
VHTKQVNWAIATATGFFHKKLQVFDMASVCGCAWARLSSAMRLAWDGR